MALEGNLNWSEAAAELSASDLTCKLSFLLQLGACSKNFLFTVSSFFGCVCLKVHNNGLVVLADLQITLPQQVCSTM